MTKKEAIRKRLKRGNYKTQGDLGEEFGVSQSYISQLKGKAETESEEGPENLELADGPAGTYSCGGCGADLDYLQKRCDGCGEILVWTA